MKDVVMMFAKYILNQVNYVNRSFKTCLKPHFKRIFFPYCSCPFGGRWCKYVKGPAYRKDMKRGQRVLNDLLYLEGLTSGRHHSLVPRAWLIQWPFCVMRLSRWKPGNTTWVAIWPSASLIFAPSVKSVLVWKVGGIIVSPSEDCCEN